MRKDGPVSHVPVWSKDAAAQMAAQVMDMQHNNWTVALGLSKGGPVFTLGHKYSGVSFGRSFVESEEDLPATRDGMRRELRGPYEDLRAGLQRSLGAPVRHVGGRVGERDIGALFPPSVMLHFPNSLFTHPAGQDLHIDAPLSNSIQSDLIALLRRLRPVGNRTVSCDFDSQMSVLVPVALPPNGAGLTYYSYSNDTERCPTGGPARHACAERHEVEHEVGKAVVFECRRPHALKPLDPRDVNSLAPRMMLHAFLVPCWPMPGGKGELELEYQLLGVLGGSKGIL